MKVLLCIFFFVINSLSASVDAMDRNECCVAPESLALISGRLYMCIQDTLIPLQSIRYSEEGVYAVPEASMMLVHCPRCNQWYIAQFGHDCRG